MTKIIKNIKPILEIEILSSESPLDINTDYVGHPKIKTAQTVKSQRNRLYFFRDKKMAKSILSEAEINQLKMDNTKKFRHQYCGFISHAEFVKLKKSNQDKYHYYGTTSCSNVWRCPSCSLKIMKGRAKEIYHIMKQHQSTGKTMGFITLTTKHDRSMGLEQPLNYLHKKYRSFQQTRFFKELRSSGKLIGQIKSTEHTYTNQNGWHPHLHNIFFWSFDTEKEVEHYQELIIEYWSEYSKGSYKAQHQKAVYSIGEISEYITKWDAVQELTNDFQKSGKGISPFQMLSIATQKLPLFGSTNFEKNEKKIRALYSEYIGATKGKRRLIISRELLDLYEVDQKTDEELTKVDDSKDVVISFTRPIWKVIYYNDLQPKLIDICYEHSEKHIKQSEIIEQLVKLENIDFYENQEQELTIKIMSD